MGAFGLLSINSTGNLLLYNKLLLELITYFRMDELKMGTLVGNDKFGNKYYENKRFFYGRNRWVEYAPEYGMLNFKTSSLFNSCF